MLTSDPLFALWDALLWSQIEVFCEAVPKAAENFLALCAAGSYDNILFHRNIKGTCLLFLLSECFCFATS